jgi:hypothetical protein
LVTEPRPVIAIAGKMDTTDPFAKQKATIDHDDRQVDGATGLGRRVPENNVINEYPATKNRWLNSLWREGGDHHPPRLRRG